MSEWTVHFALNCTHVGGVHAQPLPARCLTDACPTPWDDDARGDAILLTILSPHTMLPSFPGECRRPLSGPTVPIGLTGLQFVNGELGMGQLRTCHGPMV